MASKVASDGHLGTPIEPAAVAVTPFVKPSIDNFLRVVDRLLKIRGPAAPDDHAVLVRTIRSIREVNRPGMLDRKVSIDGVSDTAVDQPEQR